MKTLLKKPLFYVAAPLPLVLLAVLWWAADRRPRRFIGLSAPASSIALSRDGSQIVCTSDNGTIQKWMPGQARFKSLRFNGITVGVGLSPIGFPPVELRFSPDDRLVIAANYGQPDHNCVAAWTVSDRNPIWDLSVPERLENVDSPRRFTFSPDARFLVCSGYSTRIIDLTRPLPAPPVPSTIPVPGPIAARLNRDFALVFALRDCAPLCALSPGAKSLAFTSAHGLQVWNAATRTYKTIPFVGMSAAGALRFSPNGRFLAVTFAGSSAVALYDLMTGTWTQSAQPAAFGSNGNPQMFSQMPLPPVWMPDSHSLWTSGDKIRQWSVPQFEVRRELPVSGPVAVSGDGRTLATRSIPKAGEPNGIWLWNIG